MHYILRLAILLSQLDGTTFQIRTLDTYNFTQFLTKTMTNGKMKPTLSEKLLAHNNYKNVTDRGIRLRPMHTMD